MTGLLHDPEFFSQHNCPGHAEHAGRLDLVKPLNHFKHCSRRLATDEELQAVHSFLHMRWLAARCADGGGALDADTYCGPESERVARSAAGGLIDLVLGVLDGTYTNGLALVRPPGHHATADKSMGFCLYNNVAVAAAALRSKGVARVAIIDFDVHHGNGTQDIFYEDDTVLYISSHQYPHYPGSGAASETGAGAGLGLTLNHPLVAGSGDDEFLAAYMENLLPAVHDFRPGFILVSAGYDAHVSDPLGGLNVTTEGFKQLTELLVQTASQECEGNIVFTLEGGYDQASLADCLAKAALVLLDEG